MTAVRHTTTAGFGATVRAELIKVRHSPSLWVLLLVTLAIAVGLTAGVTAGSGAEALYERQADGDGSRYSIMFFGPGLAVWAYTFFGATVSAGEFGSGVIRYSFVATIILLLGSLLPVVVAEYLPPAWGETVPRWMPGALIESLAGLALPGSPGYLPLPLAVTTTLVWIALFIAVAVTVIRRRDE